MINLAEALSIVEASKDHKVLRRLEEVPCSFDNDEAQLFTGIYTDVETTGLDVEKDEVIEMGAIPFLFDSDGHLHEVLQPFHSYREPSIPITEEITKLTGIDENMVKGCRIDLGELLDSCDLMVAHNAGFDRKMLERVSEKFKTLRWACSQTQVPWRDNGFGGTRLEYILNAMGRFYEAHGAVEDCRAGLYALSQPVGGKPGLSYLLEAVRAKSWHCWALRSDIALKDLLKKRKYMWNPGEDGRPKAWHKFVDNIGEETEWLSREIYRTNNIPARFDEVTAKDRFSVRE